MMAAVRSKNTGPEVEVRKALHRRGFRYRIHVAQLPGKPDIVLPKYKAVILVHGCFWHGHNCSMYHLPRTRTEFWSEKVEKNRRRDEKVRRGLCAEGWRCLILWECALRGPEKHGFDALIDEVVSWLRSGLSSMELRGRILSASTD